MFGALAFCLLILSGYYPPEIRAINLDTDWFYRKGGKLFYTVADRFLNWVNRVSDRAFAVNLTALIGKIAEDAPYRIALLIITPFTKMGRSQGRRGTDVKKNLREAFITSSGPIGISALVAAFVLMGLFFLS
jgi:multicomponent Na+:H+ antiporter subunit D